MMNRRTRKSGLGVAMLVLELSQLGHRTLGPVTLIAIALQILIFMEYLPEQYFPLSLHDACISPLHIYYRGDWKRLLLSALYHIDDSHLYYNLISFASKGIFLEKHLGSLYFAYLIWVFIGATGLVSVGLGLGLEAMTSDSSYISTCAVGFSAVIFALKVLSTHYQPPGTHYVMGIIPMPSKYICWSELIIIQILVPNVSFTGHLAGIIVGLWYTHGPLKLLMDLVMTPKYQQRPSYRSTAFHGPGTRVGQSRANQIPDNHTTRPNYYAADDNQQRPDDNYNREPQLGFHERYTGGFSEEEQLRSAIHESIQEVTGESEKSGVTADENEISLEEIRKRRLKHLEKV